MVRDLLKILAGAFVVFMVLAIADEWSFFATAWFGRDETAGAAAEEDLAPAVKAVRATLALMAHLYASGGDPRFAERMPASPEVVDEVLLDIAYLARNGRWQELDLVRLAVDAATALPGDRCEVRTTEYWVIRTHWLDGGEASDPPRSEVLACRYLLIRDDDAWRVLGWETGDRQTAAADPTPAAATVAVH